MDSDRRIVERPLPVLTDENRGFWEAARAGELRMQRCDACEHIRYPPVPICPVCLDDGFQWHLLSGFGEVLARLVFHQTYHPAFADEVPYNVVLVQLDEGPRMFSNVVGTANDDIHVGDRVAVLFEAVTETISIPKFRITAAPTD